MEPISRGEDKLSSLVVQRKDTEPMEKPRGQPPAGLL